MAAGTKADFQIYNNIFHTALWESIDTNFRAFNGAAAGTIQLVSRQMVGEWEKSSFFQQLSTLINRRDPTSLAGVEDQKFTQGERVSVKVNRRIGPAAHTLDSFRKIGMSSEVLSMLVGNMAGQLILKDYLNAALRAVVASVQSSMKVDADDATISHVDLVDGLAKFGDDAERIQAWVMHSKTYFDLVKDQITNLKFDSGAGVAIRSGSTPTLGRPVIITDQPILGPIAGSPVTYKVLGLQAGAVSIIQSENEVMVSDIVTGLENLVLRIQGEYAFNVDVMGMSWNVASGGVNPDDTALGTAANWDKVVTSDRDTVGVEITVQ